MKRSVIPLRLRSFRIWVTLPFFVLLVRLWVLQVVSADYYQKLADGNRIRYVPGAPAPRGIIYDRNGVMLATSKPEYSVCIIPGNLPEDEERTWVLRRLSTLLHIPEAEIRRRLEKKTVRPYDAVVIARRASLHSIAVIEENRVRLRGVIVQTTPVRRYNLGSLAAHVLGHIGKMTDEDMDQLKSLQLEPDTPIGKLGAEKTFDRYLLGVRGQRRVEVNARGDIVRMAQTQKELPGASVVLTIDAKLQAVAEAALKETGHPGSLVAIDVRNGDIIALASQPSFDPNIFGSGPKVTEWNALLRNPDHPLLNRAISSAYPPGSTFKVVTAAAALAAGVIQPSSTFICRGSLKIGRRTFRCHRSNGHGALDLYGAMAHSCDVYFYNVGKKLGAQRLTAYARMFGLGSPTGIDIPGEKGGTLPTPDWVRRQRGRKWYLGDTANYAIGQGQLLTTPLQMALVTAIIAADGVMYRPHILKKIIAPTGELLRSARPQGRAIGIERKHIQTVKVAMRQVMTSGTGAGLVLPGVRLAGKTGTAEAGGEPHSWFICFAPYDAPRFAVAVIVEHAGHGSKVAGPIALRFLRAALHLNPETPEEPRTTTGAAMQARANGAHASGRSG